MATPREPRAAPTIVSGLVLALVLGGCVPTRGGWNADALARRHPEVGDDGHRLADLAPHVLPRVRAGQGELVLFLCRWETDTAIPVVLPGDASTAERDMLRRALLAWAAAGIGVRFEEVDEAPGGIHFRFVQQGDAGPLPTGAGDTLADCRVDAVILRGDRVSASLRYASIHLRRDQIDGVGLARPLGQDERYGAALHEVGHALGFASHVAAGGSIMRPSPGMARRAGSELREGEWTGDPNLAALYALPSGTRVGRIDLTPKATKLLARFITLADRAGMQGPYSRVGSQSARLFYRDADGGAVSLGLRPWPVQPGDDVGFVPNPRARRWLDEAEAAGRESEGPPKPAEP